MKDSGRKARGSHPLGLGLRVPLGLPYLALAVLCRTALKWLSAGTSLTEHRSAGLTCPVWTGFYMPEPATENKAGGFQFLLA